MRRRLALLLFVLLVGPAACGSVTGTGGDVLLYDCDGSDAGRHSVLPAVEPPPVGC